MTGQLISAVVSHNRLELLQRTLASYRATVTLPHYLIVVDNASGEDTREWLETCGEDVIFLQENRYPGYAANHGWETGLETIDAEYLHRSDNDVEYQPGWCEEIIERFQDPRLGQLGLRTLEEEGPHAAVGGNCVIRRELWEQGIRYDEQGWGVISHEDAQMSHQVLGAGWNWMRAERPCIEHLGVMDLDDPYYVGTMQARGLM